MHQKEIIWEAVLFGTILLLALGGVLISFVFLYQRKRYRHRQEIENVQATFNREMLNSKAEIQEQTLQHIASEIHDNLNPTLSVINLNLARAIPVAGEPAKEIIIDSKVLVKQLMAEMRALSGNLNVGQISRIGFIKSLEQYVNRLKKTGFYMITFINPDEPVPLAPNRAIILLRICQEALNNIIKHANAKNISITLSKAGNQFSVVITDDGTGFIPGDVNRDPQKEDSTGLYNMRNRAQAIDADFSIKSSIGDGTHVIISLNLLN